MMEKFKKDLIKKKLVNHLTLDIDEANKNGPFDQLNISPKSI